MSTKIKPGQIWAWQDTVGAKGPHNFRFEIVEAGTDVTYQYRPAPGFDPEQVFAAQADVITANAYRVDREPDVDDTPSPLDPSEVKAGDTVTLSLEGVEVTDTVADWERNPSNDHYRAYLDHKPAPKPEWKPGTTGTATVLYHGQSGPVASTRLMRVFRTSGVVAPGPTALPWVDDLGNLLSDDQITDFVPDEPRPLPTREDVGQAIHEAMSAGGWPFYADSDPVVKATDAVMSLFGGESR